MRYSEEPIGGRRAWLPYRKLLVAAPMVDMHTSPAYDVTCTIGARGVASQATWLAGNEDGDDDCTGTQGDDREKACC